MNTAFEVWHTSPPEAVKLKTPPAALPGANLLKRLINRFQLAIEIVTP